MKIKHTLFAALLATVSLGASAQKDSCCVDSAKVFQPYWYVQAQGGAQYTLAEIEFGDLLSGNAQAAVGYNFNKVSGMRFALNMWKSKAGWDFNNKTYEWGWSYIAPTIDYTANLSNLISGYNPCRLVDVYGFVGVGLNFAWGNGEAWEANAAINQEIGNAWGAYAVQHPEIVNGTYADNQNMSYLWSGTKVRGVGQAGIMVDFKVSRNVSLGAEFSANFTTDRYNSKKAGNADWYFNGLIGIKYNFNGKKPAPAPQIIEKIVYVEKERVDTVEEKAIVRDPLSRDIFFTIAKSQLLASEMLKIEEIASYLKQWPEARVNIIGLCDKGTGNDKINIPLSQKRADIVKKVLMEKFGIEESRISAEGRGSSEQPFSIPELNRVARCEAK